MQWLFDIVLDMIWNDIYDKGIYRDRGDPAGNDFTKVDLTTDGNWHDLDLSSIVPEHAKAVLLYYRFRSNTVDSYVSFRENGNVNTFNKEQGRIPVAGTVQDRTGIVSLDTNRKIEYRIQNIVWDFIDIVIRGWWL